jgi:citrate synthase
MKQEKNTVEQKAKILVSEAKERHQRILGFGHRVHTADPRTKRLFTLAHELGIAGDHVALARAIEQELELAYGRKLPINVDGAIAALISDMGFDWRLGKAFFLLGRVAGLTAHVYEEQTKEKPMRKMFDIDYEYAGPRERRLP